MTTGSHHSMRRRRWIMRVVLLAGTLAACLGVVVPQPAAASVGDRPNGHVLIISVPRLTWDEVAAARPPNLMRLFDKGAVGLCSIRTSDAVTNPGDAYLSIGAGNRMNSVAEVDGRVVERSETIVEGDPSAYFQRTTGIAARKPIIALGKPNIDAANDALHFGSVAGSMGSALSGDGQSMAVIANADRQPGQPLFRHAGLAAMDRSGQIEDGMVSGELLRANPDAAFGLEIDREVAADVFAAQWAERDVVLVELSDLERAEAARAGSTPRQGEAMYRRALIAGDELVGTLMKSVDLRRDTVIVVAPTAPGSDAALTTFAVAGRGVQQGWATSSTTRRTGYVTLTDIAPTVLAQRSVAVPEAMNDTRIETERSDMSLIDRIARMRDLGERAVTRDAAFGPITVTFVVVLIAALALAVLCLARLAGLAPAVRGLSLWVLAVLPTSFLIGMIPIRSPIVLGVVLFVGAAILAGLAWLTSRIDPGLPPLVLIGLLWLVLAVDIATGGHLQINTVFGYSPIVAGRFAGFGNQAFSMIAISSLLLATAMLERRSDASEKVSRAAVGWLVAWFALLVVLDGHPAMGADVGGVLAFVPAAAVAVLIVVGIKVRLRLIALIGVATVAILGVFAAIDLQRPVESQTHLGRFVTKVLDGDAGEILQRKLAANIRVLTSIWAWVIPIALIYFAYLTWRPNRTLQRLNVAHPQFRTLGIAGLTLGVLAMALNDSGVSLPAIMLAIVLAYVSYLVIALERAPVSGSEGLTDDSVDDGAASQHG